MGIKQYLTEGNDVKDIKIVLLTGRKNSSDPNDLFKTAKRFKEVFERRGINHYIAFTENCYLTKIDDKLKIYNIEDAKGFEISKEDTIVIARNSVMNLLASLDLLSRIERNDIFCINSRDNIEICADKYRTILRLNDGGIQTPKTALISDLASLENAFERVGGKFPCVLKTVVGSQGVGVFIADTWMGMKSTLQAIWKLDKTTEILMQEYIEADYDIRIHVLGGKVIAAMKRIKIKEDFRSNYSLGGNIKPIELTEEQEKIAILTAKAVDGVWVGVDMMQDREGNLYVLEVNSSPGTEGIEIASKINVINRVINFASNKDNWVREPLESGYIERITIEDIGDVTAKMDTGNGAACVINADKWEVKDKKIIWWHDGKKFEHDQKGTKHIRIRDSNGEFMERPTIYLNVEFNGKKYKDVEFTVSNRMGMSTSALMNRKFIRMANLTINPAKKYALTIKGGEEAKKEVKESKIRGLFIPS